MSLGNFSRINFQGWQFLKPTINNQLDRMIIVHLKMAEIDTYEFDSMVHGYHQYQSIWSTVVGEELQCRIELSNPHDLFAVAICKSGIVVSHVVPKRISSICLSFLRRGGTITCKVTGPRRYSADLLQGGLEIS